MAEKFPLITLHGSHNEIGFQHGKKLKGRINLTLKWYKNIIKIEKSRLLDLASFYKSKIFEFNPAYCEEIEAIAQGAEIDPLWIYMLNARSEIMNLFRNECTASYFKTSSLLGQNWDWAEELEELAVLMQIEPDNGPKILMMTEPGIIGKIGFNSNQIGVCLNFLESGQECNGVPIHIILRSILESKSMNDALRKMELYKSGKSANVLIGDANGDYIDIEFAGENVYYPDGDSNIFIHTNHYLGTNIINHKDEKSALSFSRFKRANEIKLNIQKETVESMKSILLDQTSQDYPICSSYVPDPDLGNSGTICTIIMDLKKLELHITRGNPLNHKFEIFKGLVQDNV